MAIEKSLYQAPEGIESLAESMPEIEIEIEDPEALHLHMDGVDIDIEKAEVDFNENLVEILDERVIESIVGDLISDFDDDIASRRDWMQTYVDGLELLGMKIEERTDPWPEIGRAHV